MIYNDKNLFIYFSFGGQSRYAYVVEVHLVAICYYLFLRNVCLATNLLHF